MTQFSTYYYHSQRNLFLSLSLSLNVSEIQGLIFHRKKKQICLDQNSEDAVANERQTGNWTFQRTLATLHPSLHRFAEQ
jgi:hypothetical protein